MPEQVQSSSERMLLPTGDHWAGYGQATVLKARNGTKKANRAFLVANEMSSKPLSGISQDLSMLHGITCHFAVCHLVNWHPTQPVPSSL